VRQESVTCLGALVTADVLASLNLGEIMEALILRLRDSGEGFVFFSCFFFLVFSLVYASIYSFLDVLLVCSFAFR